jgi:hypothetical protein
MMEELGLELKLPKSKTSGLYQRKESPLFLSFIHPFTLLSLPEISAAKGQGCGEFSR